MKSYLRYEPDKTFGIISSPQANAIFDFSGHLALTGVVRDVSVWNLRHGSNISRLQNIHPNYPYQLSGEVCALTRCFDAQKSCAAAGYSDGTIKIFNYISNTTIATLRGHTSAISSLYSFGGNNQKGSFFLASGSCDCDIIVWDLVSLTVLTKLRGHKDAVTDITYFATSRRRLLISSSKDTLVKVWCLDSAVCIQTIVGHHCEVWSLACVSPAGGDVTTVVTGGADGLLRGYQIDSYAADELTDGDSAILQHIGTVSTQCGGDKVVSLKLNRRGDKLAAQSTGKVIDFFSIRSFTEVAKKRKRRVKRAREKSAKAEENIEEQTEEDDLTLSDILEQSSVLRCPYPVRGFDFSPTAPLSGQAERSPLPGADAMDTCLVSSARNMLEIYKIPSSFDASVSTSPQRSALLDLHGHRSDVRCVCLSADGRTVATCSSDGLKFWSTNSGTCTMSSSDCGYGVNVAFAPGGRFAVLCTMDGFVKLVDSASGAVVMSEQVHETRPVYGLAIRPDGKGFMTGAGDKFVKFWDFKVNGNSLSAGVSRQLQMSTDVLSLCYSPARQSDKLLVSVGLLDGTVQLLYDDSLRFFLSLYGHKLPVLCLDISYDSNIIVSGSADKTIKIWGLDFGDCHRSLLAHEDSVMAVRFQPGTHCFFSAGKDGNIKFWDADRFECVLLLSGHKSSIWSLCISTEGSTLVSGGQDRSIRLWKRTDDLVFVEEERERALEAKVAKSAEREAMGDETVDGVANGLTSLPTADSLRGGEQLVQALDAVENILMDSKEDCAELTTSALLGNVSPIKYFLGALQRIPAADLEQALLLLPFHSVGKFINCLLLAVKNGLELELCGKAAVITLRIHLPQLASSLHSGHLQTSIQQLGQAVRIKVAEYRALAGRNLAGLRFMQRSLLRSREEKQASIDVTTVPLASSGKKAKKGTSGQKTQKKRRKVSLSEIKEGLEEFMDD